MTLSRYLPLLSALDYVQNGRFDEDLEQEGARSYMTYKALLRLTGHLYYGLISVGLVVGASERCFDDYKSRGPPPQRQAVHVNTKPNDTHAVFQNIEQKLHCCHSQENLFSESPR